MEVGTGETLRMQRGLAARLRPLGLLETMSWAFLVLSAVVVGDVVDGSAPVESVNDALWLLALVVTPIGIRVLVATEYIEATTQGLRWRTLFVPRTVSWEDVAQIGTGRMSLFGWLGTSSVVKVRLTSGRVRRLRASVFDEDEPRRGCERFPPSSRPGRDRGRPPSTARSRSTRTS